MKISEGMKEESLVLDYHSITPNVLDKKFSVILNVTEKATSDLNRPYLVLILACKGGNRIRANMFDIKPDSFKILTELKNKLISVSFEGDRFYNENTLKIISINELKEIPEGIIEMLFANVEGLNDKCIYIAKYLLDEDKTVYDLVFNRLKTKVDGISIQTKGVHVKILEEVLKYKLLTKGIEREILIAYTLYAITTKDGKGADIFISLSNLGKLKLVDIDKTRVANLIMLMYGMNVEPYDVNSSSLVKFIRLISDRYMNE